MTGGRCAKTDDFLCIVRLKTTLEGEEVGGGSFCRHRHKAV